LIKSIQKNKYPQNKLQIFVIAHNCNDDTAKISRDLGAIVYEYNNPLENTMGYAFKYLFSKIEEDYGTQNYDGFFLFNADNILSVDYFEKMNDAFEYFKGERVITSCRNSKNFGANVISASYGLYFLSGCRFECRGRSVLDCSTRVQGTGYVINSNINDTIEEKKSQNIEETEKIEELEENIIENAEDNIEIKYDGEKKIFVNGELCKVTYNNKLIKEDENYSDYTTTIFINDKEIKQVEMVKYKDYEIDPIDVSILKDEGVPKKEYILLTINFETTGGERKEFIIMDDNGNILKELNWSGAWALYLLDNNIDYQKRIALKTYIIDSNEIVLYKVENLSEDDTTTSIIEKSYRIVNGQVQEEISDTITLKGLGYAGK